MGKAFEDAFAFYLSYHSDPINQLIHIVFVWPILFTAQILLAYTPAMNALLPVAISRFIPPSLIVNINLLFTLKYASHYAYIEQPGTAGVIASALVVIGYLNSLYVVQNVQFAWVYALGIHLFSWAAQIYGHHIHEKRQPAFVDNMEQALVTAPLFVVVEVMTNYFGYKPEFTKKMQAIANENIRAYRASKEQKAE